MMADSTDFVTLADLYLAYRKAKVEAFHENTHFSALAFSQYERRLQSNLRRLRDRLTQSSPRWMRDPASLGGYMYAPKSIDDFPNGHSSGPQLRAINPAEEWRNTFEHGGKKRAKAAFRLVITATVEFHVISALWILKVGHIFDAKLSSQHVYANRVRRFRSLASGADSSEPNRDCLGLFPPYFSAYRSWRENGLLAMKEALARGEPIVAITMDLKRFYHNISPRFLLDDRFHRALGIKLSAPEKTFTNQLVQSLDAWYRWTPDHRHQPRGAIPVGLSASKVISNALLHEFDVAVSERLSPTYYGRYVDDIFLVIPRPPGIFTGNDVLRFLATRLSPLLTLETQENGDSSLRLQLPYADDSSLIFTGSKQKIFDLSGQHGLDLIEHIGEQIRAQSSEHRLLSELPSTDIEMAARALLATPNATLEADALRKADAVSIRRLGFALLLRDVEAYARDLRPGTWKTLRRSFYNLVNRHLLTPRGFFDYAGYLHRVFGVMIASKDFDSAAGFLSAFKEVTSLLRETTSAGTKDSLEFERCLTYYCESFVDTALKASTVERFDKWQDLGRSLREVSKIGQVSPIRTNPAELQKLSVRLLLSDWGRRSYKDYWIHTQREDLKGPPVPLQVSVQRVIRLGEVREFRKLADLKIPFWPALTFPTRPLSLAEIGLVAPQVMNDPERLRRSILALRGARIPTAEILGAVPGPPDEDEPTHFVVPETARRRTRIAVTSVQTTDEQWRKAALSRPDHSLKRYQTLRKLVNRILRDYPRPQYVVLPECSVPRRWALGIASKLAQNKVSFLAGLEYYFDPKVRRLRNDCFLSLTTSWPGYPANVIHLQPKLVAAHDERAELKKLKARRLFEPGLEGAKPPVYLHGDLFFGVLLCSDLTNIENRSYFQGAVDTLFILEWNPDVRTFSFLIEATAHDMHAFAVQINNRSYGDSRVRVPYRDEHKRDLVRVKGGVSDYYVLATIDYQALRAFHQKPTGAGLELFKPLPIGFKVSRMRRSC